MLVRLIHSAVLVGLIAVAGCKTHSEDECRLVTHPADSTATARLADWTADLIGSHKLGDPIRVHALVTFDTLLIEQLRDRQIERHQERRQVTKPEAQLAVGPFGGVDKLIIDLISMILELGPEDTSVNT